MNLGFIGVGNMAGAIIRGIIGGSVMDAAQIRIFDVDQARAKAMTSQLGAIMCADSAQLIKDSDMIVMAVKPHQLEGVLAANQEQLSKKAVISIAAGWSMDMLRRAAPKSARLLRVMPNTPALVGEGMAALSRDTSFTPDEQAAAERMFSALGRACWVEERQMEAVIGVSGSGPAYAYLFIEAMADGGVYQGLTRQQATEMAAQTLLGAARMVLEGDMHPGALKDMVCSPGGTTIAAVHALEKAGFRGAVMDAVNASADKAREMRK